MIVEFCVENFRSICDEQVLSLFADKDFDRLEGNFTQYHDKWRVLNSVAIYGANASGKTNILRAIDCLRDLVINSDDYEEDDEIPLYQPYAFSSDTPQQATKFSIEFYLKKVRYHYQVHFDRFNILFEKLDYYPGLRVANLFTREHPSDWEQVKFGSHFKGGKKQISFFANNLYLSKAGREPSAPKIIREVYKHFRSALILVLDNERFRPLNWHKENRLVDSVQQVMAHIDVGIDGFNIQKNGPADCCCCCCFSHY